MVNINHIMVKLNVVMANICFINFDFNIDSIKVNFNNFNSKISSIMVNFNIGSIMVNFNINCCTSVNVINQNLDHLVNNDFNDSINLKLNEHFHEFTNDVINCCVRYP